MDVTKIKISELTDIDEIKKLYRKTAIELNALIDDLFFEDDAYFIEKRERVEFLKKIVYQLRVRIYELEDPSYSDGTIDLYCDHDAHFTITEHQKKIPVGVIEYFDCKNPVPGNISYEIVSEYRGHHYALRALKILGKKLLEAGITCITITANNNKNYPSMKTIEEFGGVLRSLDSKQESGPVSYTCDLEKIYSK